MNGFYRRSLPSPPAVDFLSDVGKQLFVEAIQDGTMEGFYSLSSYFQTQPEPTFCGLTTLSMVLNALSIDPCRKWKGPWRWFDESMLDFCEPLEKIKARGISFGTLECMAHCAGAKVEAFRASRSSIDDFRKHVIKCSTSDQCHVISSYHRAALKQTGAGHYSPIGGYHVGKDMALILDVARFKYPPHWVPLTLLWEGMNYVVESTRQTRGFMLISRPHREPGMLYTLNCNHESWISTAKFLINDVPLLLQSEDVKNIHKVLSLIVASLPYNFEEFIKWFAEIRRREAEAASLSTEEKARLAVKEEVLKQVQETGLFNHVASFFSSSCDGDIFTEHCCQETCMKCCEAEDDKRIMPVCETVMNGDSDQGVGVMIPLSPQKLHCTCNDPRKYIKMYPATTDVLTVLLLSLPSVTWSGIKDDRLLREIDGLVSIENLPVLLQEEVLHIRKQLHLLKKCQEGKVDDDLGSPFA